MWLQEMERYVSIASQSIVMDGNFSEHIGKVSDTLVATGILFILGNLFRRIRGFVTLARDNARDIEDIRKHLRLPRRWHKRYPEENQFVTLEHLND